MSRAHRANSDGRNGPLHVGLVAGPETLANLGPVVRHMVVGLLDEPMRVTLVHPAGTGVAHVPTPPLGSITYCRSRLPLLGRRYVKALAADVARAAPALLHALDADALSLTRQLAAELELDYLVSLLTVDRIGRIADARCRGLLAGSEPIRQMLLQTQAAPAESVSLVRPGVHRVSKATCFVDPTHAPAVVAAGTLRDHEPFAAVLRAFTRLLSESRQCVFFLVGSGRAESSLRRLAEKLGLMNELTFVDHQDPEHLRGILRAADIFIAPTTSNRVEVELLTAMAAGVPVLAAENPAADCLVPGKTALTFHARDVDELAERLKELLDDHADAREMADSALALLGQDHSPARMAEELAQTYGRIVAAPTPP